MKSSKGFTWYGDGINEETELKNVRSGATNYPGKNVMPTKDQRPGPATHDDDSDGYSSSEGSSTVSSSASSSSSGGVGV